MSDRGPSHELAVGGAALTGNWQAYEYLPKTSAAFPAGDAFLALMDESGGFAPRRAVKLTSGVAYVYVGIAA